MGSARPPRHRPGQRTGAGFASFPSRERIVLAPTPKAKEDSPPRPLVAAAGSGEPSTLSSRDAGWRARKAARTTWAAKGREWGGGGAQGPVFSETERSEARGQRYAAALGSCRCACRGPYLSLRGRGLAGAPPAESCTNGSSGSAGQPSAAALGSRRWVECDLHGIFPGSGLAGAPLTKSRANGSSESAGQLSAAALFCHAWPPSPSRRPLVEESTPLRRGPEERSGYPEANASEPAATPLCAPTKN